VAEKAKCPEDLFLSAVAGSELSEKFLDRVLTDGNDFLLHELRCRIARALGELSYRERGILEMRLGLGDGYAYTLAEAGMVFRLTRERIRQIQVKALRKLRQRANDLKDFVRAHGS
jgi:DNA-directed RNA polymerase sigma subunit (sigma70/sigma32)